MRYDEFRELIIGSSPDDWALLEDSGGVYSYDLREVGLGDRRRLKVEAHHNLAVYRADIDLQLTWGLTLDSDLTFEGMDFADPSIALQLVDGLWRGALVTRWPVLWVNGGRCYLPVPQAVVVAGGASDREVAGWKVKAGDVAVARLLQRLVSGSAGEDFDGYLQQTGAVVVPDDELL